MDVMGACFMLIRRDPMQTTYFLNCACAVRGGIPVRMLEINPEKANASDGDVILRKSLFMNDLRKRRKKFKIRRGNDVHT